MRKTFALVACLILALSCVMLTACGGANLSDSPYVGTWVVVKAEAFGEEASPEEVFDGEFIMILSEDGTATITVADEDPSVNTWRKVSGGIRLKGDFNLKMEDQDGTLVGNVIGMELYFEKQ